MEREHIYERARQTRRALSLELMWKSAPVRALARFPERVSRCSAGSRRPTQSCREGSAPSLLITRSLVWAVTLSQAPLKSLLMVFLTGSFSSPSCPPRPQRARWSWSPAHTPGPGPGQTGHVWCSPLTALPPNYPWAGWLGKSATQSTSITFTHSSAVVSRSSGPPGH